MKILAIETSCDETAIAILNVEGDTKNPHFEVLSNVVLSQIKIHKPFGGVVPNLAQREHQKNLVPILLTALREAKMLKGNTPSTSPLLRRRLKKESYSLRILSVGKAGRDSGKVNTLLEREPELLKKFQKEILNITPPDVDAIAVTNGPGLEPALWVGVNFAKALSFLWKKPLVAVNHLEGHIYASWLRSDANTNIRVHNLTPQPPLLRKERGRKGERFSISSSPYEGEERGEVYPKFPLLALIVSGGHTELVLMKKHLDYKILGATRDDAAGEAFDKVAKMLGLGYPGGPEISKLALDGSPTSIKFPRPMINSGDLDFSFSGLKTAVLYKMKEIRFSSTLGVGGLQTPSVFPKRILQDIAASFEQAVVDVLVSKTKSALKKYSGGRKPVVSLVVGGGVAANKKLRASLENLIKKSFPKISLHISPLWLCGDNAAMIAAAAYFKAQNKKFSKPESIKAQGGLKLA